MRTSSIKRLSNRNGKLPGKEKLYHIETIGFLRDLFNTKQINKQIIRQATGILPSGEVLDFSTERNVNLKYKEPINPLEEQNSCH
jgi:hypothetical protein